MLDYTVAALTATIIVAVLTARTTSLFRERKYWVTMLIVLAFQVPVDGFLTKASRPIVLYNDAETLGWRVGWNTPIEDFLFGFSLVTLSLLLWKQREERLQETEQRS